MTTPLSRASRPRLTTSLAVVVLVLGAVLAAYVLVSFDGELFAAVPEPPLVTAGSNFSFGASGDFGGVGNAEMVAAAKRMQLGGLSFLLALGDLGYTSDEPGWCSSIKTPFNHVEVIAGNHDTGESSGGDIAEDVRYCPFTLNSTVIAGPNTPGYGYEYYFDYPAASPLGRFIMVAPGVRGSMSYDFSVGSAHYNWLVDSINGARSAGIPWVVVGMHKMCIVSGDKGSCEMGQAVFDKLVDLKVDLILQAHAHIYERSKQVALSANCPTVPSANNYDADCVVDDGSDDFYPRGMGSVAVITGVGGVSVRSVTLSPSSDAEANYFVEMMGSNANTQGKSWGYGYTRVDVAPDHISVQTDLCPPGTAGSDGQCPSQQATVFKDTFQIGGTPPPPPPPPPPVEIPVNAFRGKYYDNEDLTNQKVERVDSTINFNWGTGTPDPSIVPDSFSVNWEGYWDFASSGIYRFTMTTDDGMRVWIDNGTVLDAWIPQAPTTYIEDVLIAAGRHDVRAEYFERSGGAIAQISWAYQGLPPDPIPTAAFTRSPAFPTPGAAVTFDASSSISLNGSLEARWDWENDGTWDQTWSAILTAQHAYAAEGSYVARLEVRDAAGLTDNETQTVIVDGTPPTTGSTVQGTQVNGTYVTPVRVTLSPSDGASGVSSTQYRIDGGPWLPYSASIQIATNGTHVIEYYSMDKAGNSETPKTAAFEISSASFGPPVTVAVVEGILGFEGWYTSDVDLTLTATGNGTGLTILFRIGGGAWLTYTDVFHFHDGRHTLEYWASDSTGQESVRSVAINVDGAAPSLRDFGPLGTVSRSEVVVTWTSADDLSGIAAEAVSVDGGAFMAVGTNRVPLALADGPHTVVIRATDHAGNEGTVVASFRIDSNPLSPTGPYSGIPLYLLIELVLIGVVLAAIARRRRRRRRRAHGRKRPDADRADF